MHCLQGTCLKVSGEACVAVSGVAGTRAWHACCSSAQNLNSMAKFELLVACVSVLAWHAMLLHSCCTARHLPRCCVSAAAWLGVAAVSAALCAEGRHETAWQLIRRLSASNNRLPLKVLHRLLKTAGQVRPTSSSSRSNASLSSSPAAAPAAPAAVSVSHLVYV
jgi:hypothetical protein